MLARKLVMLLLVSAASSYGLGSNSNAEPKNSRGWFARASDLMTLRTPGTAPFRLHVSFQADAGQELLGHQEERSIITGQGTYDEIWIGPHKWRREVTLGNYHALEIEADGVRRIQASSDYEPGRVDMLIDALLNPIPRVFLEGNFKAGSGWKLDHVSAGDLALVRLSKSTGSQRAEYTDSFYFLPSSGALAMSNFQGLVNIWSDDVTYNEKVFPKQITMKIGNRTILTADVSIVPAGNVDASSFVMEGGQADPGMTLRPLHPSEVRMPEDSGSFSRVIDQLGRPPVFSMMGTLDRHGRFRELEMLSVDNPKSAKTIVDYFRDLQTRPPTIDGSACQVRVFWQVG